MKSSFTIFMLTILLFIILGCSDEGNPVGTQNGVLIPFSEGNFWVQEWSDYKNDTLQYCQTDTIMMYQQIIWKGDEYYGYGNYREGIEVNLGNSTEGISILNFENDPNGELYLLYKYPVRVGETWSTQGDVPGRITCISVNETVSIPAGIFQSCIKYEFISDDGRHTSISWVKPGIGEVQMEALDKDREGHRLEGVLQDWHFN